MKDFSPTQKKSIEKIKKIDPAAEFFFDEKSGIPKFVKGTLTAASSEKPEKIAEDFLEDNKGLLDLNPGLKEKLSFSHIERDKSGSSHVFFSQAINDTPVFEGSTQVHIDEEGKVVAYKDYRIRDVDVPMKPSLSEQKALDAALYDIGNKFVKGDSAARLVLFRDSESKLHLAWEISVFIQDFMDGVYYIIDAHDASIIYKFNQSKSVLSRFTYDAENKEELPGRLILEGNQIEDDAVAQSAHDFAKIVYNYYSENFGRDSYDDQGARLVSTVHFKQDYNNAFWSGWFEQMVYGDGDGFRWKPLALALDIVGHELTHAVTSSTARFVYAEQAGALDESFADIFGVLITNDGPISDWEMGEGVFTPFQEGDALRDLSDPSKYNQPDHMDRFMHLDPGELPDSDKNDNGYVHFNSGIPNKAFYLLIEGGDFHGVKVKGIGRDRAEQILYLALTKYLASSSLSRWTFMQARYAMLNACRQLYGDAGDDYASIKNAWAAVGVGEPSKNFQIVEKNFTGEITIPDDNPTGIRSKLAVESSGILKEISVGILISHNYIGDLRVSLKSPKGERSVLHDRSGLSAKDIVESYDLETTPSLRNFLGKKIEGEWILEISDHAPRDQGKLLGWNLRLTSETVEEKTFQSEISPNIAIPDNTGGFIESRNHVDKMGALVNAEIFVDIVHTWIGDLKVSLTSPDDEIILHDRTGNSRKDLNKIYNSSTDPALQGLVGKQIQGDWILKVIDLADDDEGILRRWGLKLTYSD